MAIETNDRLKEIQLEASAMLAEATVSRLNNWIIYAKLAVLELCPNAELLYTVDRRGRKTHAGVYSAPPRELNDRGNYSSYKQYAPQLIGKRIQFKDGYPLRDVLHISFELWMDALRVLETNSKQRTISQLMFSS